MNMGDLLHDDTWRDAVPEGAEVNEVIHLVHYVLPDGESRFGLHWQGSLSAVEIVGLLRLAERDVMETISRSNGG
jgi:hypothetical protein